ncbi:hypothetical protein [Pseudomonas sp. NPDC089534]|uniref:hypothetical protein n=1 Tax=Pseudomonas sp. NPDC089534 TaxID=3364468 RepID=UPI003807AFB5
MKSAWWFLIVSVLFQPALADTKEVLVECPFSDGTSASLLTTSSADGQRLFVKIDNQTQAAFTDMPDSDFVGEIVLAKCAGSSLIYAMNYGSPYLKGAVLRKNPTSGSLERIDFAEKAVPSLLYLGSQRMRLVIPNEGYEVSSKFLVYDYSAKSGQSPEAKGINALPDRKGYKVITLN